MTGSILQVAPGNNQIPKTPKMVMQNQKERVWSINFESMLKIPEGDGDSNQKKDWHFIEQTVT